MGEESPSIEETLERMNSLLEEYRHYDTTSAIVGAWCYHIAHRYSDVAMFDCVHSIGEVEEGGRFLATTKPDFVIPFPGYDYAVVGEVKASLSRNPQSLASFARQTQAYCNNLFSFQLGTNSQPFTPKNQDVLVIVPSRAASPAALALQREVVPQQRQHVCLCHFDRDTEGETLFFNHHPLPDMAPADSLRDRFLPQNRRISHYLAETGIELRLENYLQYANYLIAGSDGLTSSLGVVTKLLDAIADIYGPQVRTRTYSERRERKPLLLSFSSFHDQLKALPYRCGISKRTIRDVLSQFDAGSTHFSFVEGGRRIAYVPLKSRRYDPFTRDEILTGLPAEFREGDLPHRAFCLAKGQLLMESTPSPGEDEETGQLELEF
jgi:hypothetical protein